MTLRKALTAQAETCTALGSPFTGQLLHLLAENLQPGTPLTDRLFNWTGNIAASGHSVPLRLAGAFHDLVLTGADPDLAKLYPPNPAPSDAALWKGLSNALTRHATRIDARINRPPQTNEVGRSAVLIAAGHMLAARFGLPIALSELGASAGLNLNWDHYTLRIENHTYGPRQPALTLAPKWSGPLPEPTRPKISDKGGTDLTPIDPRDPKAANRLLAYIWPDQPERLARTRAAIAVASTQVDQGDAADWLEQRLKQNRPDQTHLIYHTIAWQYFPPETQTRATQLIETAGKTATPTTPLAWLRYEADGQSPGAGLSMRLWPGDHTLALGRADFHGRWVNWRVD